jgi:hypothetical protein
VLDAREELLYEAHVAGEDADHLAQIARLIDTPS